MTIVVHSWPAMQDGELVHANQHACDRWSPHRQASDVRRLVYRLFDRIERHQREREAHQLGYRELGGEGG